GERDAVVPGLELRHRAGESRPRTEPLPQLGERSPADLGEGRGGSHWPAWRRSGGPVSTLRAAAGSERHPAQDRYEDESTRRPRAHPASVREGPRACGSTPRASARIEPAAAGAGRPSITGRLFGKAVQLS